MLTSQGVLCCLCCCASELGEVKVAESGTTTPWLLAVKASQWWIDGALHVMVRRRAC